MEHPGREAPSAQGLQEAWLFILKVMGKNLSKGVTWSELPGAKEGKGLSSGS